MACAQLRCCLSTYLSYWMECLHWPTHDAHTGYCALTVRTCVCGTTTFASHFMPPNLEAPFGWNAPCINVRAERPLPLGAMGGPPCIQNGRKFGSQALTSYCSRCWGSGIAGHNAELSTLNRHKSSRLLHLCRCHLL